MYNNYQQFNNTYSIECMATDSLGRLDYLFEIKEKLLCGLISEFEAINLIK